MKLSELFTYYFTYIGGQPKGVLPSNKGTAEPTGDLLFLQNRPATGSQPTGAQFYLKER